nr:uncharacterized mitochondrial protein AtMg00810-like [Tanacetum cinerariifolium]
IYVNDIIFGATNKALCQSFEKLMKDKFQMSLMRELTFFLGLQVKQKKDGIFISQYKYVAEILRKFGLSERKSASTPIDVEKPLLKDSDGEDVDVHTYRSMIGSLMYLNSSRPDILFTVCACDSPFDLVAYSDSDYAGASLERKSTTGGCQFLGCRLISWQCKKQTVIATSLTEAEYVAAASGSLEDNTYSDDEEDVGAATDFSNLETTIIVSPILTTRVHKDHHVTQIIGDLSSDTQTRSMTRMVKDQGGLTQINNEDFHICMFACFLLQEEPKRVHQALKDLSWIEAM